MVRAGALTVPERLGEIERRSCELTEFVIGTTGQLHQADISAGDRERLAAALEATVRHTTAAGKIARLAGDILRPTGKRHQAAQVIDGHLPRDRGWHPSRRIIAAALAEGIGERTLQRAAADLGIERRRAGEFHSPVMWRWPASAQRTHDKASLRV